MIVVVQLFYDTEIMFICFTCVYCACLVLLHSTCVGFDLVKSPEVTPCGLQEIN